MTSQLNVDTISAKNGTSPVALTKQQATKTWVNYDAADQATRGSFGQSSLADNATGDFTTSHTNNFASAEDKCVAGMAWDTADDSGSVATGVFRAGVNVYQKGDIAQSTSALNFQVAYGSRASTDSDGAAFDVDANYFSILGDLA
tara:strand:+ start:541 stop:975 length:435 start_codon:yes stop_codon:yes gene_type:complete